MNKLAININKAVACHECDLLINLPNLQSGKRALCPRCGYILTKNIHNAQDKILAFAITAFIFLCLAIPFSFLSFNAQGSERVITLIQSIEQIALVNFNSIAILMLLTTILIPGIFLIGVIYIILSLKQEKLLPYTRKMLKFIFSLLHWNMAEIFLVGILVSFIKIASLAKVTLGLSFVCYVLFILCLAATLGILDKYQVWQWIKEHE